MTNARTLTTSLTGTAVVVLIAACGGSSPDPTSETRSQPERTIAAAPNNQPPQTPDGTFRCPLSAAEAGRYLHTQLVKVASPSSARTQSQGSCDFEVADPSTRDTRTQLVVSLADATIAATKASIDPGTGRKAFTIRREPSYGRDAFSASRDRVDGEAGGTIIVMPTTGDRSLVVAVTDDVRRSRPDRDAAASVARLVRARILPN